MVETRGLKLRAGHAVISNESLVLSGTEFSAAETQLFGELIGLLSENVVESMSTETIPTRPKLSELSLPFFFDKNDEVPGVLDGPDACVL